MTIHLDSEQTELMRDVLEHTLTQLRIESARTDGHGFREMLHRRERVIESVLAKLARDSTMTLS